VLYYDKNILHIHTVKKYQYLQILMPFQRKIRQCAGGLFAARPYSQSRQPAAPNSGGRRFFKHQWIILQLLNIFNIYCVKICNFVNITRFETSRREVPVRRKSLGIDTVLYMERGKRPAGPSECGNKPGEFPEAPSWVS
jgi:hypothetical protein